MTGSNVESVAEDEIMRMLILMRNFLPGYLQASSNRGPCASANAWRFTCNVTYPEILHGSDMLTS